MTAHDDAVMAAAEALDTYAAGYLVQRGHIDLDDIRIAVAAAAPILLAAERARIAAAIRSKRDRYPRDGMEAVAFDTCARVAETAPEEAS